MSKLFEAYARESLVYNLLRCSYYNRVIFNRMYYTGDKSNHLWIFNPIEDTVKNMPKGTLDWAMQQVHRTLDKEYY